MNHEIRMNSYKTCISTTKQHQIDKTNWSLCPNITSSLFEKEEVNQDSIEGIEQTARRSWAIQQLCKLGSGHQLIYISECKVILTQHLTPSLLDLLTLMDLLSTVNSPRSAKFKVFNKTLTFFRVFLELKF